MDRIEQNNQLLNAAFEYRDRYGFSVIPVSPQDKKPTIKWKQFQTRKPTDAELIEWFGRRGIGIAIVTGSISDLFVLDKDKDSEKLNELLNGAEPTAKTRRGGFHYYFTYPKDLPLTVGTGLTTKIDGFDFRGEGGYVIAWPTPGWEWVAAPAPRPALPSNIKEYLKGIEAMPSLNTPIYIREREGVVGGERGGPSVTIPIVTSATGKPPQFLEGSRDNALFNLALTLFLHGYDYAFVDQTIVAQGYACEPPFPVNESKAKVRSAWMRFQGKYKGKPQHTRQDFLETTTTEEIRNHCLTLTNPVRVGEIYRDLDARSKEDKDLIRQVVHRMVEKGEMVRDGGKVRAKSPLTKLRFDTDNELPLKLAFPGEMERFLCLYPRTSAVIAGVPNAGKTIYLLNFIRLNMMSQKIVLFSSENPEVELPIYWDNFAKEKDKNICVPRHLWEEEIEIRHLKTTEQKLYFFDHVVPDAINVFDYIKMYDNFWEINKKLDAATEKLTTGVVIAAIQMDPELQYGRGRSHGLENPRLYVTLSKKHDQEKGTATIVKCKTSLNSQVSVDGAKRDYQIVRGCKMQWFAQWSGLRRLST